MDRTGIFPSKDFATLYGAADLPELVAVAGLLEKGLSGWLLLHPSGRQAVMMVGSTQQPVDPIAASQISQIRYPEDCNLAHKHEPWAKTLLNLLFYQFDVEAADFMVPIWSAGSLLAIVGISGISPRAKSLAEGMVLAVRRLHEIDGLKRDVEGHRFLLARAAKSIVLAWPTGRILNGTEGGWAALKELKARTAHHNDPSILPAKLWRTIEAGDQCVILEDLQANISCPPLLPPFTTAEPLVAIAFSKSRNTGQAEGRTVARLTAAERRVHDLLVRGDRNKEIANALGISIHTAKHHVSSVLSKMGYSDRILLIAAQAKQNQTKPAERYNPKVGTLPKVSLPPPRVLYLPKTDPV